MAEYHSTENQRTVDYALDVLEQFNGKVAEHSLANLSKKLKINKNIVFRILTTLTSKQYLHRDDGNGHYRLGPKAVVLGQMFKKQMLLITKARPVIEELANKCDETVSVALQSNSRLVFLDAVEANHAVKVVPRLGIPLPMYCTAAGKILLATMNQAEMDNYISTCELKRHTASTITDAALLKKQVSLVARQGYATENEEFDSGLRAIAIPFFDDASSYLGAISIAGPAMRLSDRRIEMELIPLLRTHSKMPSTRHDIPLEMLCSGALHPEFAVIM